MEVQDNSYDIFTQAKKLYTYHKAARQLQSVVKKDAKLEYALVWLKNEIEECKKQIRLLGGKVAEGIDVWGASGPIAKYQNEVVIDYEVGSLSADEFISTYRNKF